MSPLKLALITLLAACVLAAAPLALRKYVARLPVASGVTRQDAEENQPVPGAARNETHIASLPAPSIPNASKPASAAHTSPARQAMAPQATATPAASLSPLPSAATQTPVSSSAVASFPATSPSLATSLPAPQDAPKTDLPYRPEIAHAQELLTKLGYTPGAVDGKLGPHTESVIKEFQKRRSLPVHGDIDQPTLDILEKMAAAKSGTTASSSESPIDSAADKQFVVLSKRTVVETDPGPAPSLNSAADVKRLQEKLANVGAYNGAVDGKWGAMTIAAVENFQRDNNIKITRKPDEKTWKKLNELASAAGGWGNYDKQSSKQTAASGKDGDVVALPAGKKAAAPENATDKADPPAATAPDPIPAPVFEVSKPELADVPVSASPSATAKPVVIKVNADAGSAEKSVLATPAAVSAAVRNPAAPDQVSGTSATATAQAAAPQQQQNANALKTGAQAASAKVTLPSGVKGKQSVASKSSSLLQQIDEAQARAAMVADHYEIGKYSPKGLETVNMIVNQLKRQAETQSGDSEAIKNMIQQADRELEKAKRDSMRKKAQAKVSEIESAYKSLKSRFSAELRKTPMSDTMSKIDAGFTAMEADYKKGNYDPIVERCDGFKLAIEMLANDAAKKYVDSRLEQKSVKSKLSKSTMKDIEVLRSQNKNTEAASLLDSVAGAGKQTPKRGARKSSSSKG
ncbi:MAG: peptidoglycan-binding protein [Candidatus Sumerlaeota bacterium]|nr:peptidoglycan-binding protein [Candidatus Sumerlaeota bacterium]